MRDSMAIKRMHCAAAKSRCGDRSPVAIRRRRRHPSISSRASTDVSFSPRYSSILSTSSPVTMVISRPRAHTTPGPLIGSRHGQLYVLISTFVTIRRDCLSPLLVFDWGFFASPSSGWEVRRHFLYCSIYCLQDDHVLAIIRPRAYRLSEWPPYCLHPKSSTF